MVKIKLKFFYFFFYLYFFINKSFIKKYYVKTLKYHFSIRNDKIKYQQKKKRTKIKKI